MGHEHIDDLRIELPAPFLVDNAQSGFNRIRLLVGPPAGQRIKGVGQGGNPSFDGNRLPGQPPGVTGPVPLFVMGQGDALGHPKDFRRRIGKDLPPDHRMGLHQVELLGGQPALFHQHMVRNPDLSDVMHGGRIQDVFHHLVRQAELFGDQDTVPAHAQNMVSGILVLVLRCQGQAVDGIQVGTLHLPVGGFEIDKGGVEIPGELKEL